MDINAGESWKLVLPMSVIFKIYIKIVLFFFLPFCFPCKILVYCVFLVTCL
jgi:hypothetical protein